MKVSQFFTMTIRGHCRLVYGNAYCSKKISVSGAGSDGTSLQVLANYLVKICELCELLKHDDSKQMMHQ